MSEFKDLPVKDIKTNPDRNPRKTFDEAGLNELAESIISKGILQPLLVRPTGKKYELVAGERRLRAAKLAGLEVVPVMIRELSDDDAWEVAIIENLQRHDVNPMEEAAAFKQMLERPNYSTNEIALKVGKSESYVQKRLKLNDLLPQYQKMLFQEEIQIGHALELCRLAPEDQKQAKDLLTGWSGVTTVSSFKRSLQSKIIRNLSSAPFDKKAEDLIPSAGACSVCPKHSGVNRSLFGDVEETDRCFDSKCYQKKIDAHIKLKVKELKASGEKWFPIIHSYEIAPKEFKTVLKEYNDFKLTYTHNDQCEHLIKGLWVTGPEKGKVVKICANKQCQTHFPHSMGITSAKADPVGNLVAKLKRNEELEQEKVHEAIVQEIREGKHHRYMEASNAASTEVNDAMWMVLAWKCGYHARDVFRQAVGAKPHEDILEILEKSTVEQRTLLVKVMLLEEFGHLLSWRNPGGKQLQLLANKLGVDTDKIREEFRAQYQKRNDRLIERLNEKDPDWRFNSMSKEEQAAHIKKVKREKEQFLKEHGYTKKEVSHG